LLPSVKLLDDAYRTEKNVDVRERLLLVRRVLVDNEQAARVALSDNLHGMESVESWRHGHIYYAVPAFSKISIYFFESPLFVIEMVLIASLLFGIYGTAAYALTLFTTGITSPTRSEETSITNNSKSNTKIGCKHTAAIEGLLQWRTSTIS
jgi:hypothetical protein